MDTRKIIQALAYFASKQPDGMIDNMKVYKILWLASASEPNTKVFSESDIHAMNLILDAYNAMTAEELSELSHKFPEWKYYETRLKDENENNSFPIKMSLMFENHDDGTGLFVDDEELLSLTQSLYTSRIWTKIAS